MARLIPQAGEPSVTSGLASRRLDIQGLRAIAVLMVILFHAGLPVPGGFVGVDVFFVISGFVITAMLHREWLRVGRIRFREFYVRRFKRLTPALALMVSVVVVTSAVILSPIGGQAPVVRTALGAMLISANFVAAQSGGGYFDVSAESNPLLNTWSLSVEEQFYLVFPALLAAGWYVGQRRVRMRLGPIPLVIGVTFLSLALALAGSMGLTFPGSDLLLGFYSPFARAWEFAAGALLALLLVRRALPNSRAASAFGYVGLILLAASLWLIDDTTPFPGVWALLPVAGTLLLLASGTCEATAPTRLLSTRPMVKVGDWSYSMYLWHWPFIVFAGLIFPGNSVVLIVAAALSMAPALASYRWVETPLRSAALTSNGRRIAMVGAFLVLPIVLAGALGVASRKDLWIPSAFTTTIAAFNETHRPHAAWEDCLSTATMMGPSGTLRDWGSCMWNSRSSGVPLYLVGDSNAGMFTEALEGVAAELDSPLTLDSAAACPLIDWYLSGASSLTSAATICREHVDGTLGALDEAKPGVVVIANSDLYVWSGGNLVGTGPEALASDREEKTRIWEARLRKTIERVQSRGHKVVIVQPIHRFEGPYSWTPSVCTVVQIAREDCEASMPLSYVQSQQLPTRMAVDRLADEMGLEVVDVRPHLCEGQICATRKRDGSVLYADPAHISVPMSLSLTPLFLDAVRNVVR